MNRPEAKAHLEFVANSYPFANTLMQVLKKMDFPVGITDRKNNYQVYMKDGEEIMDLLAMLGAPKAVAACPGIPSKDEPAGREQPAKNNCYSFSAFWLGLR